MIEQQLWGDVKCSQHMDSFLQFVCLEQDCQQNALCEQCVMTHEHREQLMTIKQFYKNLQELETEQICQQALANYNQNKKKQLQSYEQFISNLKMNFDILQKQENEEYTNNANEILKIKSNIPINTGHSQISSYIQKLSKIIVRNTKSQFKLKETKLCTNDSLESLKKMIEQSCKSHFENQKQSKITFLNTEQFDSKATVKKFDKPQFPRGKTQADLQITEKPITQIPPKIDNQKIKILNTSIVQNSILNTTIVQNSVLFSPRLTQFSFLKDNQDIQIQGNGKIAEQKQTLQKEKQNHVVYLSPNLNLVNEATVAFQYTKIGFSAFPTLFGIYACDVDETKYPSIYSQREENQKQFYLFSEKPQNDPSEILQLRFSKNFLEFLVSQNHTEKIEIKEQQNKQFVFCFVLQPGNTINLMN